MRTRPQVRSLTSPSILTSVLAETSLPQRYAARVMQSSCTRIIFRRMRMTTFGFRKSARKVGLS